jgi:hypothetical protein
MLTTLPALSKTLCHSLAWDSLMARTGFKATLLKNTISGSVFSNEFPWTFNNTILRDNDLPEGDLVVGVTRDFLGSGADIFGGVVASTDEQGSSFGALF